MKLKYSKLILSAAMLLAGSNAFAQGLNSAYYTNDYKFRHDMNPAFGNEQSYIAIPILGNINVNLHGNFGYEDVVMNNPMYPTQGGKKMTTFMNPYISTSEALSGFSTDNNRIIGNVGITILSAGFKGFGGYNTIELNSKTSFGVSLPYGLFEFAKNTGNKSYDIGNINAQAMSYVELGLGHSRQINDKLRIGAKLKFLFGVARADFQFKDVKADLSSTDKWTVSGQATADVYMKGFTYQSETDEYNDPNKGQYDKVNDVDVDGGGLGGFGMAVDLGAVYKINEDWTVNAAVVDLGFINWSNHAQAVNRSNCFEFNGFHDTSVTSDSGETIDDKIDDYGDQITDFINLKDNGDQGSSSTGVGATINLGCEYNLPVYRKMTFGLLSSTRLNGAYSWTEARLSANWTPLKWLDGGVNLAVNSFTTSMGWILNIHPKGYNFYIGMDHLLGKTSKEGIPLSSNASIALGMSITW
ncbi:MAG: DUF5723 family protein [Prevotellaceae bacterium]|nr:DUF5723 family protein [Prevotellaceae bacterium]